MSVTPPVQPDHVLNLPSDKIEYNKKNKTANLFGKHIKVVKSNHVYSVFLSIRQAILNLPKGKPDSVAKKTVEWTKIVIDESKRSYWVKTNDLARAIFPKEITTRAERTQLFDQAKAFVELNALQKNEGLQNTNLYFVFKKEGIAFGSSEKENINEKIFDPTPETMQTMKEIATILGKLTKYDAIFKPLNNDFSYSCRWNIQGTINMGNTNELLNLKEGLTQLLQTLENKEDHEIKVNNLSSYLNKSDIEGLVLPEDNHWETKEDDENALKAEIELADGKTLYFYPDIAKESCQFERFKRFPALSECVNIYNKSYESPDEKLKAFKEFIFLAKYYLSEMKEGDSLEKTPELKELFKLFVEKNFPEINEKLVISLQSTNLLCMAVKEGAPLPFLDVLIEKGIDLDFQESDKFSSISDLSVNRTALTLAIEDTRNRNTIALHLIGKCSKETLNKPLGGVYKNMTLFQMIVMKGYREKDSNKNPLSVSNFKLAEAMIKKGADIKLMDNDQNSALLWALKKRDEEMVTLLVKSGAKIDKKKAAEALAYNTPVLIKSDLNRDLGEGQYYLDENQFKGKNNETSRQRLLNLVGL